MVQENVKSKKQRKIRQVESTAKRLAAAGQSLPAWLPHPHFHDWKGGPPVLSCSQLPPFFCPVFKGNLKKTTQPFMVLGTLRIPRNDQTGPPVDSSPPLPVAPRLVASWLRLARGTRRARGEDLKLPELQALSSSEAREGIWAPGHWRRQRSVGVPRRWVVRGPAIARAVSTCLEVWVWEVGREGSPK